MPGAAGQIEGRQIIRRTSGRDGLYREGRSDVRTRVDDEASIRRGRGTFRVLLHERHGGPPVHRHLIEMWDPALLSGDDQELSVVGPYGPIH